MPVTQMKEKFGTVRVYCGFGWSSVYSIWRPRHCWIPKWWPIRLDNWLSYGTPVLKWINLIVRPIHKRLYAWRYKKAVQKWPHLYNEIVSMADYGEVFEGIVPGYKHNEYWVTAEELENKKDKAEEDEGD